MNINTTGVLNSIFKCDLALNLVPSQHGFDLIAVPFVHDFSFNSVIPSFKLFFLFIYLLLFIYLFVRLFCRFKQLKYQ